MYSILSLGAAILWRSVTTEGDTFCALKYLLELPEQRMGLFNLKRTLCAYCTNIVIRKGKYFSSKHF
jgi:hypothetical protein